jgi:hypothetical protein
LASEVVVGNCISNLTMGILMVDVLAVGVGVGELLAPTVLLGVGELLGVRVFVGLGKLVEESLGAFELEGVLEGEAPLESVAVGVLVPVRVAVMEGVPLGVPVPVRVTEGVEEGLAPVEMVAVGDGVDEGDWVGEAVPEGDTVAVAEEERELVGVPLGLAPMERVAVGEVVGVRVEEEVEDGEGRMQALPFFAMVKPSLGTSKPGYLLVQEVSMVPSNLQQERSTPVRYRVAGGGVSGSHKFWVKLFVVGGPSHTRLPAKASMTNTPPTWQRRFLAEFI